MGAKRTREELRQALETQLGFLRSSSRAFDDGNQQEAYRLATVVHMLVHDYGEKYKSILRLLGIKGKMRFVSSHEPPHPDNVLFCPTLVAMRIYGGDDRASQYVPIFDGPLSALRRVQFDEWWTETIVQEGAGRFRLSRKNLIFALRNQEGGAHFDDELRNPNYARFSKPQISTPTVTRGNRPPEVLLNVELVSMRQIAWEVDKSVSEHGPI
jgi:hypothetical protein